MRRGLALIVLVLAAVLGLPTRQAPARAASATPVSFYLNWIKNVEFSGLWVPQAKGWWAQAGLQMTARPWDGNTDPTIYVGAGKATFGFQDGAALIIARAAHVPVRAIWASCQISPFAFITMPNSHITSVKQFKGKRIGYQAHQEYVLETMLNSVGLTIKDVTPVVVGYDPTYLVAGKVDAYLAYLTNEPIELAQKYHIKVNIIPASTYGYNFYSTALFTTDSLIASNPALVRKVVSIVDRGWRYAIAHPAEAARLVVPRLDNQDSVSQQTAEMQALARMAVAPGSPVGSMSAARWQTGINLLLKYKQIGKSVPAHTVFTTQFLPAS